MKLQYLIGETDDLEVESDLVDKVGEAGDLHIAAATGIIV